MERIVRKCEELLKKGCGVFKTQDNGIYSISCTSIRGRADPHPALSVCQNAKTVLQTERSVPKGLNCHRNPVFRPQGPPRNASFWMPQKSGFRARSHPIWGGNLGAAPGGKEKSRPGREVPPRPQGASAVIAVLFPPRKTPLIYPLNPDFWALRGQLRAAARLAPLGARRRAKARAKNMISPIF